MPASIFDFDWRECLVYLGRGWCIAATISVEEAQSNFPDLLARVIARSEERRVGKECRSRWSPYLSSRRRHTRCLSDWSSDVCSSDLGEGGVSQQQSAWKRHNRIFRICWHA